MEYLKKIIGHEDSRRNFLKKSGQLGIATMLAGTNFAFAEGSGTIRVGLIGCGGRGTGAGIIDCAESSPGIGIFKKDVFSTGCMAIN